MDRWMGGWMGEWMMDDGQMRNEWEDLWVGV